MWAPENRSEHISTNLLALFVNRSYLVHFEGAMPTTLTIWGTPELRRMSWVPNSFNLVGFHLDPANPPTFEAFFDPSPAHQGQAAYRLDPNGVWTQVVSYEHMVPGESYWVYSQSASTYEGPLSVELPGLDGLDFSAFITHYRVGIKNLGTTRDVTIRMLPSSTPVPLTYRQNLPEDEGQVIWPGFSEPMVITAPTNEEVGTEWAVDRAAIPTESAEALMEISDGAGSRYLVPVRVRQPSRALFSGLWIGNVYVNAVSESQLGLMTPEAVDTPFVFRILIHVDEFGQVRLLKDVIQMWEDGTYIIVNDPGPGEEPLYQTDQPGQFVLITDHSLIPQFQGATMRDGEQVGYRVSTAAYDFPENELLMNGAFDFDRELDVELAMEPNDATNPFKHKYHPDHDNKTADFEDFKAEAYEVHRNMTFEFTQDDPDGEDSPQWGSTEMGGVFTETVSGLFAKKISGGGGAINDLIHVEGTFKVERISAQGVINE